MTPTEEAAHYKKMVLFSQKLTGSKLFSVMPGINKYGAREFKNLFKLSEL